ncbi:LysE family translocator [Streptomyces sp. TLI_146]|uniref:LysE family translocator n=1 Tax=Streptomyces sp. TLI_146 TaxID=1938858 RepID=UPI000C710CEE|nr:LysE family translocator [Streptomyces sp. TLI_146]PKV90024.1 threonine/homoserine/homoserine lactone efflux protein [Streptomyces sp. TLI_146]
MAGATTVDTDSFERDTRSSVHCLGVTALLTASHLGYEVLRWAGAAYLVWMGARMLLNTLRDRWSQAVSGSSPAGPTAPGFAGAATNTLVGGWRQGAVTNLLNPKAGALYVALLPQFIPAGASHLPLGLLLTSVHVTLGLAWSAVLIAFTRMLRDWLRKPRAQQLLDRVTGTLIVGFGLRLALAD